MGSTLGIRMPVLAVLEEAVHVLEKAGIEVCQFHEEQGGVGMFEISLEPFRQLKQLMLSFTPTKH